MPPYVEDVRFYLATFKQKKIGKSTFIWFEYLYGPFVVGSNEIMLIYAQYHIPDGKSCLMSWASLLDIANKDSLTCIRVPTFDNHQT